MLLFCNHYYHYYYDTIIYNHYYYYDQWGVYGGYMGAIWRVYGWYMGRTEGYIEGDIPHIPPIYRPVHLLRVFLLRVLESNFPGDSL